MPSANGGTWTYSDTFDPSESQLDEVRFLMQDNDPTLPLLSDLEIQYLIDYWLPKFDSLAWVAAAAADRVAVKFAGLTSITADGVSVQVGDISQKYADVSERLRREHKDALSVGGETNIENILNDSEPDQSIEPLNFSIGGMDNPAAGKQTVNQHMGPSYSFEDGLWH